MSKLVKSGARAVADVKRGMILATVDIAATPERVFRAISSGDEIVQWWGSAETYRTTEMVADLRPGGHWRSSGVGADGHTFFVEGEYQVVDPPRTLVQTWKPGWDEGLATTIRYDLEAIEGGTRLTLRHEGFGDRATSCSGHAEGWQRVLGWLTGHLVPVPANADKFYLCRLLAPRPTFMQDMSPEELAIMRAHAAYWTEHMNAGRVVVFGPVADPKGGWGVGIVRVPDESAVNALRDADPVILSGRGFAYEILPMVRAILPS